MAKIETLAYIRRWALRKPHWSSPTVASFFGGVAWRADHSLLSVAVSALICFWILHLSGKFAIALAIGALQSSYHGLLQWLKPGPHHWIGMQDWLLVLRFMLCGAWIIGGLLWGPIGLGELSAWLSKRGNKAVSPRYFLALMLVPYTILFVLSIISFGGLDK